MSRQWRTEACKALILALLVGADALAESASLRFNQPPSDTFLNRWAFQTMCDHIFDPCNNKYAWPTAPNGVTFNPKDVKAGDTIFVRDVDYFFETIGRTITQPFIMITHGEFRDTTLEHQLQYLDDPKIIAWFSIHPPKQGHKKYFPLPLGLMQEKKYYKKRTSFNSFLADLRKKPKSKLLYMNFDDTLNKERQQLKAQFSNAPYCFNRASAIPFEEYLEEMADYKFALSPRGWGPDCYRTWEALFVGTIPIVRRNQSGHIITIKTGLRVGAESTTQKKKLLPANTPLSPEGPSQLDTLYEGLPILVIDSWEELSESFLQKKYAEITSKSYDISALYFDYWRNKIENVRSSYLQQHGLLPIKQDTNSSRADKSKHIGPRPTTIDFDEAMQFDLDVRPKAKALSLERRKDPILNFCRRLYQKYPYEPMKPVGINRIPKIVHLIWVGPNKIPETYTACMESIKKFLPSWECKLWTDADIPGLKLTSAKYYDEETNYGGKADILRYELLYRYGGVFLDIDFEVTQDLSPLHAAYEFYCCLMPSTRISVISNGVIGSIPGHPILRHCLDSLGKHRKDPFVLERTGPILFQSSFYAIAREMLDRPIIALPKSFFFPIDATKIVPSRKEILAAVLPHTFGIHHWAGSWVDEKNHAHHKSAIKKMRGD